MKKALVTGAAGQDGYFLTRYLKSLGYEVWAGVRHDADHLNEAGIQCTYMEMRDHTAIQNAIRRCDPDEIYNLAGQSFVPPSWVRPEETFDVNTSGLARILECVESLNPNIKVYQASSSEMFGTKSGMCNEETEMRPNSPYGSSKLAAHHLCHNYRQRGLFVVSGICFNHESHKRGPEMVTRKISRAVAKWANGIKEPLKLGSLDPKRDWGFAGDYVKAMHTMMQLSKPDDFVISTGQTHSVSEFLTEACRLKNVEPIIEIDERFTRKGELPLLWGSYAKANHVFGFEPKVGFYELVKIMVDYDTMMLAEELKNETSKLQSV